MSTLIIIRKPPFGTVDSWEGLRSSLSFYASNSAVEIILEGPGVFNWIYGITPESKDPHSVSRLARDIGKFEIPVYAVGEDLTKYGLGAEDLISPNPEIITKKTVGEMIASHETTIAV